MPNHGMVYVVDDEESIREPLAKLIASAGYEVRCCAMAHEFLAAMPPAGPACVVLDVRLPDVSGLDLQELMARRGYALPIIMITGHGDVSMAVRAVRGGAVDFLQKPFDNDHLLQRIQEALEHAERTWTAQTKATEIKSRAARLSPREREVMHLIASGKANKQTASVLGLSPKTVEIHRANVMQKMEAGSLAELVRMAGSLELNPERTP